MSGAAGRREREFFLPREVRDHSLFKLSRAGGPPGDHEKEPAVPTSAPVSRRTMIWTVIITSVAVFMVSLDNLVVTTALPSIREHLHASLESLEWTVNAYTLTFAVLLLTGATLGERFG